MRLTQRSRGGHSDDSVLRFLQDADALYHAGQKRDAMKRYDEATRRWPNDTHVLISRGLGAIGLSPSEESMEWLERAANVAWDKPRELVAVAVAMTEFEEYDRAKALADRIDETAAPDFDFVGSLAFVKGRVLLYRDNDAAAALPHLKIAYAERPAFDDGHALIYAYLELQQYDDAVPILNQEMAEHPDDEYLAEVQAWMIEEGILSAEG
jgi:tetratricopeptide (TPR) repeat protein